MGRGYRLTPAQESRLNGTQVSDANPDLKRIQESKNEQIKKLAQDYSAGKLTQQQYQSEIERVTAQSSYQEKQISKKLATTEQMAASKPNVEPTPAPTNETSKVETASTTGPDTIKTKELPKFLRPLPNILHEYPSYTYGISLHLLGVDDYNQIVKTQKYTPKNVLIASAGRYNNIPGENQFIRNPIFNDDFYFDSLNIETVIGFNAQNRSSNAVKLDFKIIEPYGMTLLDKIIEASEALGGENYLSMPYLLQIDFFGINDIGEIVGAIPNQMKRIPIRILKLGIKAGASGSEYDIEASPYNHSAYDLTTVSTPATFEIVAGTVAEFFQSTEMSTDFAAQEAQQREEYDKSRIWATSNGQIVGPDGQVIVSALTTSLASKKTQATIANNKIYKAKSYGDAINNWQNDLFNNNQQGKADRYFFKFDDEIGKSAIVFDNELGSADIAMTDLTDAGLSIKANSGVVFKELDYSSRVVSINSGTSIDAIFDFVIRNSDYIRKQLVIPEKYKTFEEYKTEKDKRANQPLNWFKVIPTIQLKEYDKVRQSWSRDITYHVIQHAVYNAKMPQAPQATAKYPVKNYNYLYTGKNIDIIDFNIEFNALYYNATTAYKGNPAEISGVGASSLDKNKNPDDYAQANKQFNKIAKPRTQPVVAVTTTQGNNIESTALGIAAADVQNSLYSQWSGDMIELNIKIIGDPMFIKQDDIFYSPEYNKTQIVDSTDVDPRITANGSLKTDNGEVYIQVIFRTPVDIDEATSVYRYEVKDKISGFSGMYRVLAVQSSFTGGQFTQMLKVVRLQNQTNFDYAAEAEKIVDANRNSESLVTSSPKDSTPVDTNNKQLKNDVEANPPPYSGPVAPDFTVAPADSESKNLSKIRKEATKGPITRNNEPVTVPPPPKGIVNPFAGLPSAGEASTGPTFLTGNN